MRIADAAAESNVGRKRRHNEDNYVAEPPVFAVADGMGGAQAGEVASALAASAVTDTQLDPAASGEERVVALIKAANVRVHQRATDDVTASGMGTTMTVAMLQADGSVAIGHVGDSRAYRLREGQIEQLTDDHSLVAELVRRGELSPEEAAVHPQRSVITRALGTEPDVDVDVFTVDARDGDVFLLCSDGLTTMVDARTISEIVQRNRAQLHDATHALIKAANDRGGDDNITAVLFAVADGDPEATQSLPVHGAAHDPDDEDTLHPEDNVHLPDAVTAPPSDVTMIVSAADLAQAIGQGPQTGAAVAEPHADGADGAADEPVVSDEHPMEVWPAMTAADAAAAGVDEPPPHGLPTHGPPTHGAGPAETGPDETGPDENRASLLRIVVALLVIVALALGIVVLVLDALPR